MVSVRVIVLRHLYFLKFSLLYFWGVLNKTIIPLALVGYEMIIAAMYYLSNRPQVSMGYRLINHAGCW